MLHHPIQLWLRVHDVTLVHELQDGMSKLVAHNESEHRYSIRYGVYTLALASGRCTKVFGEKRTSN